MYIYIYIYIYVCVCVYTHTHNTHTHTHTNKKSDIEIYLPCVSSLSRCTLDGSTASRFTAGAPPMRKQGDATNPRTSPLAGNVAGEVAGEAGECALRLVETRSRGSLQASRHESEVAAHSRVSSHAGACSRCTGWPVPNRSTVDGPPPPPPPTPLAASGSWKDGAPKRRLVVSGWCVCTGWPVPNRSTPRRGPLRSLPLRWPPRVALVYPGRTVHQSVG